MEVGQPGVGRRVIGIDGQRFAVQFAGRVEFGFGPLLEMEPGAEVQPSGFRVRLG